tara:strand:- start:2854 stop:4413 length:1560 start_codon:yes stop_codon:yes gene_type:complete
MATPSGLGVSTGIGKGEAQVFAPVKSEYFKNKANLALKERDKQEKAFVDIGSAPVFNPDTEEYKQELAKVRQFYRDNQRSILEGDFDTKLKLNQLTSGLTQWAANSNAQGKLWTDLKKKAAAGETNFYQKDLDNLDKYGKTPYEQRQGMQIGLRAAFDKKKFFDEGIAEIKKLPFDPAKLKIEELDLGDGTTKEVIINEKNQNVGALDDIALAGYSAAELEYGKDQVGNEITLQEYKDFLRPYFGSDRSVSQISKPRDININQYPTDVKSKLQLQQDTTTSNLNTISFLENEINALSTNAGKINQYYNVPFKSGAVRIDYTPTSAGIPIKGNYKKTYSSTKSGKPITTVKKFKVNPGEKYDIEQIRDMYPNTQYTVQGVAVYNTFAQGQKGSKSGKNISGYLVPENYTGSQKTEKRVYATIKDKNNREILVPLKEVQSVIKDNYKADWEKIRNKLYNSLEKSGDKAALKDFIKGSSSNSSSSNNSLTQKQLDIAAKIRAKNPEKVKGYTDEEIIQAFKK